MYEEKKISLVTRVSLPPREAAVFATLAPDNRSECVLLGLRALGLREAEENEEKNPTDEGGVRAR